MGKSDKGNWGIRISYHGRGGNVEHWYQTESEREKFYTDFLRAPNAFAIKSIKRKNRKND